MPGRELPRNSEIKFQGQKKTFAGGYWRLQGSVQADSGALGLRNPVRSGGALPTNCHPIISSPP